MERNYWLRRKRAAMAMARSATCSQARLVHYAEAGRHSVRAAFAPFMLPSKGPATEGEREALRPSRFVPPPPPTIQSRLGLPEGHESAEGRCA